MNSDAAHTMNRQPSKAHKPRIVVIGASGRLGSGLVRHYSISHEVIPVTRAQLDLKDLASICQALEMLDFECLILPGALTAVDYCESHEDEAFAVNAEGPREVARVCAEKGARLVYISTDFVFDGGKEGPYTEEDPAHSISVYGASKRKGEEYVLEASANNLVVRISWLYGGGKPAFPEWIIQQADKDGQLSLPGEKIGSPTCSEDVVRYLEPLLGLDGEEPASGVVHLCNTGSCTWQEWGQFCLDEAVAAGLLQKNQRISANRLEDIAAFVARRPVNSVLDTTKFTELTGIVPRSWQEAMKAHFSVSPLVPANAK